MKSSWSLSIMLHLQLQKPIHIFLIHNTYRRIEMVHKGIIKYPRDIVVFQVMLSDRDHTRVVFEIMQTSSLTWPCISFKDMSVGQELVRFIKNIGNSIAQFNEQWCLIPPFHWATICSRPCRPLPIWGLMLERQQSAIIGEIVPFLHSDYAAVTLDTL